MYYYSNCLIEALRAKIFDFRGVKLRYLPAKYNEVFVFHIMWERNGRIYDFHTSEKLNPLQILWHKGRIRVNDIGYYKKALETMMRYAERKKNRGK